MQKFPVLAALSALLLSTTLVDCGSRARRPNVLLISIDTLRADHLSCYGYGRNTTPQIDAFARTAVVFEQASSSAPWTLPALASLHTGLFTASHGCDRVDTQLHPEFATLAETLRNAGWDTAMVACHLFLGAMYGLQQGFTHVDEDLIAMSGDLDQSISSPGVSDRGLRFIENKARAADGVPWMLWLHYFDPHAEYLAHPGFSEQFGTGTLIDLYDGEIAFTDHHIGRVLSRLAELGLDRDTIVVLTADHGEEFNDHGNWRHGTTLYQEVIHVPLLVRAPGLAPGRIAAAVGSVDVMPTVLDLCALTPRMEIEGASLLPLARAEPVAPRELLLECRWGEGQDLRGLRREDWKYCEDRRTPTSPKLLFQLIDDPLERHDLLAGDANTAAAMRTRLERLLQRASGLARQYPAARRSEPVPADIERLQKIGYVGDDGKATAEAPR